MQVQAKSKNGTVVMNFDAYDYVGRKCERHFGLPIFMR